MFFSNCGWSPEQLLHAGCLYLYYLCLLILDRLLHPKSRSPICSYSRAISIFPFLVNRTIIFFFLSTGILVWIPTTWKCLETCLVIFYNYLWRQSVAVFWQNNVSKIFDKLKFWSILVLRDSTLTRIEEENIFAVNLHLCVVCLKWLFHFSLWWLTNIPSPPPSNYNAPFSLVSGPTCYIHWRDTLATYLYMNPSEKPTHQSQNLLATLEKFSCFHHQFLVKQFAQLQGSRKLQPVLLLLNQRQQLLPEGPCVAQHWAERLGSSTSAWDCGTASL